MRRWLLASLALALPSCGDDGSSDTEDSDGSSGSSSSSSTSTTNATGSTSTADPTTSSSTSTGGSTGGSAGSTGPGVCAPDFVATHRYLWSTHVAQSVATKIDTETLSVVGTYLTADGGSGNPAPVAVDLNGDAVIVNRSSNDWMLKIFANEEDCVDSNGEPGIQTSSGDTPLAWGEDECIAWVNTDFAPGGQAAAASTAGTWDEETCRFVGGEIWGSHRNANNQLIIHRLSGNNGVIEDSVTVGPTSGTPFFRGGAVDSQNNLWGVHGGQTLVRVQHADLAVDEWQLDDPARDVVVDRLDRVWACSNAEVARFDPESETFDTTAHQSGGANARCIADGNGLLWVTGSGELTGYDQEELQAVANLSVPAAPTGVAADLAGYLWITSASDGEAYRVHPDMAGVDSVAGQYLDAVLTMGDHTGFRLINVSQGN